MQTQTHARARGAQDPTRATHWLPRAAFVGLLASALGAPPHAANVRIVTGATVSVVRRTQHTEPGAPAGGGVEVEVALDGGGTLTLRPPLLLGCDGVASSVRAALQAWAAEDAAVAAGGRTFGAVEIPCPSAGLRFKVLQLPAAPKLRDGTELTNTRCALRHLGRSRWGAGASNAACRCERVRARRPTRR